MPAFVIWIIGSLGPVLMSVAGRVLVALGISVLTFEGVDLALSGLKTNVFTNLGTLPATVLAVLYQTKVDQAINLVFSALIGSVAVQGLSGAVKRFSHR